MTSKRKEHCSRFPASILHPRVTPHVFHSWSLSRRPIHSEEQKWHGESGVIFFPLKNRKEKHLWARAQLLSRAKALCTFPSTLTVSLPVCGLDVGIRRGTFVDVRLTIVDVSFVLFFVFWGGLGGLIWIVFTFLYFPFYFVCLFSLVKCKNDDHPSPMWEWIAIERRRVGRWVGGSWVRVTNKGWSLVLLIQTGFLHVYGSGNEQKKSPIEERSYNKNLMVYWFRVNREFWAWK